MQLDHIWLEGPSRFLDTVNETGKNILAADTYYYMGIIEAISRSEDMSFPETGNVCLHLREGVASQDAKAIINLVLGQIAEKHNMQAKHKKVRLMYEDGNGDYQEL